MLRLLILALLLMTPVAPQATAQPARDYSDMPVAVVYCEQDPGRINPGGGKDPSPQQLIDSGQCTPAEGVALTFVVADDDWDFEHDEPADTIEWDVDDHAWFARCDTDAAGTCALNSPVGFDIVIGAVLHESTVKPGYMPAFFPSTTHNYTEFAGYGLALIPDPSYTGTATEVRDHQTLALNITTNGEPANVLTEWEQHDAENDHDRAHGRDHYLATNAEGWVSDVIAGGDRIEIELVNVSDHADVTLACSGVDDPAIEVKAAVDHDGDLTITVPTTDSDIRCDVQIRE